MESSTDLASRSTSERIWSFFLTQALGVRLSNVACEELRLDDDVADKSAEMLCWASGREICGMHNCSAARLHDSSGDVHSLLSTRAPLSVSASAVRKSESWSKVPSLTDAI